MFKLNLQNVRLKVLKRLGLLNNRLLIHHADHHGKNWTIPIIDGVGYGAACGMTSEPWIFNLLNKLNRTREITAFVDVGVNIGQTLIKIKSVNPAIPYFGFEVNPNCVYYAEYLIRLNHLEHAHLTCVGLGDKQEILKLNYEGLEDTRATLLQSKDIHKKLMYSRQVPVVTLDQFDLEISPPDHVVLKVDVEGVELEVFRGAEKFINKYLPSIVFEVLPHHSDEILQRRQREIHNFMLDHGYRVWRVNQDSSLEEIGDSFENIADYSRTDYIASHLGMEKLKFHSNNHVNS